ncbi:MAG: glycosyltransferase family 2 protein, partial [Planctomycetaceae bacterium]|nr:glycosyltransferase family 2 protein [Planctomycetaceae bacterium]
MASPSVDVVIPVFNGERFLEQAIASVLDQSLVPAKVLVVDDGSTDSSREIAMRFGNPVSCLAQANQGPSAARNRGIAAASSEWVAFLDADDYWMPGRLERMLDVVERNPDVDFVYTGLTRIAADGSEEPLRAVSPDRIRERLRYDCPIFP